ncbi:hypothetical protein C2G38_2163280 [Gigaspora rosea]|uniref:Uncharacterized protein n=1 Tax=Gigaspora rosea TaxID=44941 RepID=A0A397W2F0_9GLOM|nr:hypothetical protein C2G38_2163280 [Gigaspora rosea]
MESPSLLYDDTTCQLQNTTTPSDNSNIRRLQEARRHLTAIPTTTPTATLTMTPMTTPTYDDSKEQHQPEQDIQSIDTKEKATKEKN